MSILECAGANSGHEHAMDASTSVERMTGPVRGAGAAASESLSLPTMPTQGIGATR